MSRQGNPIGIALIGCGAVSQLFYLPGLIELSAQKLIQVRELVDIDPAQSQKLSRHFPKARLSSDLSQAGLQDIQLGIVASPNYLHYRHSLDLLSQGISVLCEKPMATSYQQALSMQEAAETHGSTLAIGMYRRFMPSAQAVKLILESGILGDIIDFHFSEGGTFGWPLQSPALFNRQQSGGGILLDIGCHALDLLIWWLGYPEKVEYADDAMGGVEANCQLKLHLAAGVSGTVRLSRDWSYGNSYRINGRNGWLSFSPHTFQEIQIGLKDKQLQLKSEVQISPAAKNIGNISDCFTAQLLAVISASRGDKSLSTPLSEALAGLQLIEICYRQRTLLDMPWFTPAQFQQAQKLNCPLQL